MSRLANLFKRLPLIFGLACGALVYLDAGAVAQCMEWLPGIGTAGSNPNETVFSMHVHDDGQAPALYIGGDFTDVGGVPARRIARWDGTSWTALGLGLGPDSQAWPHTMATFDDGSGTALYVGGAFESAGGLPAEKVAKWDGSAWSALGGGVGTEWNQGAHAMAVYDDGSGPALFVGGNFTSASGVVARGIAKWDGTQWSALGTGVYNPNGTPSGVGALVVHDDGSGPKLIVGGRFDRAGGIPVSDLAAWDGTSWSSYAGGTTSNGGHSVSALLSHDFGQGPRLVVGGLFTEAGPTNVYGIAMWDGSTWDSLAGGLGTGFNLGRIYGMTVFDDGTRQSLFVTGSFAAIGGVPAVNVAKWDGLNWSALGGGLGVTTSNHVGYNFAIFNDGQDEQPDLYAGGAYFIVDGGIPSKHLARWNSCAGPGTLFCNGDSSVTACPCSNAGEADHGCENSAATGGALLHSSGSTSTDTVTLHASGELPTALSIFLQGSAVESPTAFGDGLRCVGGQLKRLYVKNAVQGAASAPTSGEASITTRSAELGDAIAPGSARYYQVYYRDAEQTFCPEPQGSTWNVTNALVVLW